MATKSRRIWLVITIILGVILLAGIACWFIIAPKIIENKANSTLQAVSQKTGRQFEISDIKLYGFTRVGVGRLTISDINHPERNGVTFNDVGIGLSNIPIGDFSISSIDVESLAVTLRIENQITNFEDILKKLHKSESETTETPSEPPAWKRYITPFPKIHVSEIALSMPSVKLHDNLEVSAVSAEQLIVEVSPDTGMYDIQSNISASFLESGIPTNYESKLAGTIKNGHEGAVSITMPHAETGQIPEILKQSAISFDKISFVLPTTFEIEGFSALDGQKPLITIDKARARLMSLPPKKVSGVYFKEVELIHPQVHEYLTSEGSAIFNWSKALVSTAMEAWNSSIKKATQDKVSEIAAEAAVAALETAIKAKNSGNEHIGEDVANAVIDSVIPKEKSVNPRDYFFSQRMFISDGKFSVDDQLSGIATTSIDNIQLEVGYRSIRKIVDYRLEFDSTDPVSTNLELFGQYNLPAEYLFGQLVIHPLRAASGLKQVQANLQEINAKTPDDSSFWSRLIPSFDLDNTVFEARVLFDYSQKNSILNLDTKMSLNHLTWRMDALSQDPTVLSGALNFLMTADLAQKNFEMKKFNIETAGAALNFDIKLDHQPRTQAKQKQQKTSQSDLHFKVTADIPVQEMQTLFDAIPHALRSELDGLTWRGTLGIHFEANGYLDTLSETQHKLSVIPSDTFEILEWPVGRNLNSLNSGFTHKVQDPNALEEHEIVIPPSIYPIYVKEFPVYNPRLTEEDIRLNYPDFVLFDDLNPWLIQLITTTEDGSFFSHEGFSPLQIKAALERNVNRQAFNRGASTISMQLVKNLFFGRNKTISRKFQEAIYTWLMESVIHIPKKRIMELYFNIIEFGPEIYGIEQAAKYYFGKRSRDLSLKESAFLMAIVPNPRKGANHRSKPTLDNWLQKTMNFYIQEMYRRKCDPNVLAKNRERMAKQGKPMIYEPCCPPKDSLQLMLDADTMSFYIPNPSNPMEYAYRPDLYTEDGTLLIPRKMTSCGMHGELEEVTEEPESIFELFQPTPGL